MAQNSFMALPKEYDGKEPWQRCPSTHCERAQECRSPNECSGTGIPALIREAKRIPLTNAEIQARHRARIRDQLRFRTEALEAILTALEGNTKPLAVKLRAIAEEGLK